MDEFLWGQSPSQLLQLLLRALPGQESGLQRWLLQQAFPAQPNDRRDLVQPELSNIERFQRAPGPEVAKEPGDSPQVDLVACKAAARIDASRNTEGIRRADVLLLPEQSERVDEACATLQGVNRNGPHREHPQPKVRQPVGEILSENTEPFLHFVLIGEAVPQHLEWLTLSVVVRDYVRSHLMLNERLEAPRWQLDVSRDQNISLRCL